MSSAYADARLALFNDLINLAPRVLGFDADEQLALARDDTELVILTPTTTKVGLPFLSLPEKEYRRQGPGSAIEQLHAMLRLLVRDRMWREDGGPTPHAALFKTNNLTTMLLRISRTDPQEFIDAIWQPVDIHDRWSEAHDWRSDTPIPDVLKQSPVSMCQTRQTPETMGWISGVSLHSEVYIDTLAILPEGALYRLTRFGPTEVRLPEYPIDTLKEGDEIGKILTDQGAPLRSINPILVEDLRYAGSYSQFQRSIRLMTSGDFLWEEARFDGYEHEKVRADYNQRIRQLFLKRSVIETVIVKHLQGFTESDVK